MTPPTKTCRSITVEEARKLRQLVLRPHLAPEENVYPGDEDESSIHEGVLLGDRLVAIGSAFNEPQNPGGTSTEWRIRGMAVLEEERGAGLGADVLVGMLEQMANKGGSRVWANARTGVVGFYQRHGLLPEGEEFDLPGIGPHFVVAADVQEVAQR
jgi:predicted GNAT family N-acyltransferase